SGRRGGRSRRQPRDDVGAAGRRVVDGCLDPVRHEELREELGGLPLVARRVAGVELQVLLEEGGGGRGGGRCGGVARSRAEEERAEKQRSNPTAGPPRARPSVACGTTSLQ